MNSIHPWNFNFGKLLLGLGEDLDREGLQETPKRVNSAWLEFLNGYSIKPEDLFKTTFDAESSGIQVCNDISFCSMCEHHLLPFFGTVTIVYRPYKRVAGLSKLPRLVDCFAHRLQIQERMTTQIATTLMEAVHAQGVLVICNAKHHCCHGRGVRRGNMSFKTVATIGEITQEFWEVLKC
jgi:GTP cyclohydrolase I